VLGSSGDGMLGVSQCLSGAAGAVLGKDTEKGLPAGGWLGSVSLEEEGEGASLTTDKT
jgi:hypothetical protein